MEAWTALDERFGRVDTVVSAAKRRVDQFPVIMKENSEQIRQCQEMVSELMGVYKELNFVHELNSQIPEANVAKLPVLPVRLCGRWAEFVEGKWKQSTWLEKEAKICESKQRWMPGKREWRRFDSTRSDLPKSGSRKSSGNPVRGLFAGATQETPSGDEKLTEKCPVHNSTSYSLEECKKFKEILTLEKEKLVDEHKLCLFCLLPGHRLSKCNAKNRCKVEGCAMRHHTLVHEVDLNITERSKARKAEKLAVGEGPLPVFMIDMNT